ncbi:MAG: hypothetical protein ACR2RV_24160 [Verrucomicrobiales bacterium]
MEIFIENDGDRLGPYSMAQLQRMFDASEIPGHLTAWVDGSNVTSTVAQLLARAEFTPRMPADASTRPVTEPEPPVSHSSPAPPPPGSPSTNEEPREQSTKLRQPSVGALELAGGAPAKFRRSRRTRVVELPKPTTWERLRIAGSATPFVLFLILLLPWISGAFLPDVVRINGYRTFSELADLAPYRRIFVATLFLGSFGIGWCSLRGALYGGSDMPGATFLCAAVAVGSLLVLTLALPAESRVISHLGGASAAFGTLLLGTAFGGIPGQGNTEESNLIMWIICGGLAVAALIFFLVSAG